MDMRQYKIAKRGVYLYVFRHPYPARIYKGNIYCLKTNIDKIISPTFVEKTFKKKKFTSACVIEPEKFYHGVLWMRKRDDELALEIYFSYIKNLIGDYTRKINNLNDYYRSVAESEVENYILED